MGENKTFGLEFYFEELKSSQFNINKFFDVISRLGGRYSTQRGLSLYSKPKNLDEEKLKKCDLSTAKETLNNFNGIFVIFFEQEQIGFDVSLYLYDDEYSDHIHYKSIDINYGINECVTKQQLDTQETTENKKIIANKFIEIAKELWNEFEIKPRFALAAGETFTTLFSQEKNFNKFLNGEEEIQLKNFWLYILGKRQLENLDRSKIMDPDVEPTIVEELDDGLLIVNGDLPKI